MQSSPRNGATVRLLAIHTTEGILRVNDLRDWKTWSGSSHATADQYGGFLDGPTDGFVAYDRASWTLRSGNPVSDNIELCGFAKWSRADWLNRPKLIESAALWLARRKKARPHIPLVKLTPEQVRAGRAGVIGHNDWTVGMKDGSHWDPGPGFPWDVVLARANALASSTPGSPITTLPVQEDDMPVSPTFEADLWATLGRMEASLSNLKTDLWATLGRHEALISSVPGAVLFYRVKCTDGQDRNLLDGLIQGLANDQHIAEAVSAVKLQPAGVPTITEADRDALAKATNDEADRRERARLNQPT